MTDNQEVKKQCFDLINTLINKTEFYNWAGKSGGMDWSSKQDRETLEKIFDYAIEKTFEVNKKIDDLLKEEIYCEDLLVLSIDNDNPKIYYLTKQIENPYNDINESIEINNKASTTTYIPLFVYNMQGYLLLGKHVGDTITYQNDGDLNEHTITILDIRKTKYSEKVSPDYIKSHNLTNEYLNKRRR